MTAEVRPGKREELALLFLRVHLGESVPYDELAQVLRLKDGTTYKDIRRLVRKFSQSGWPIDIDPRQGTCRLRKAPRVAPRGIRGLIPASQRIRILSRDRGRCQLCGIGRGEQALDGRPARMEPDHIVPVDEGGATTDDNLQTLCHVCNHDKAATVLDGQAGVVEDGLFVGLLFEERLR